MTKALKYDKDKPRMELLSRVALEETAKVLTYGANKYTTKEKSGDHNWRNGFNWSRLYGAAFRHLFAHLDGESLDEETGLSHLAHASCCIMFLLEHEKRNLGIDDRYKQEEHTEEVYRNDAGQKITKAEFVCCKNKIDKTTRLTSCNGCGNIICSCDGTDLD